MKKLAARDFEDILQVTPAVLSKLSGYSNHKPVCASGV